MKDRIEILVSGFGGQGVVRLGQIIGTAAVNQGYRVRNRSDAYIRSNTRSPPPRLR